MKLTTERSVRFNSQFVVGNSHDFATCHQVKYDDKGDTLNTDRYYKKYENSCPKCLQIRLRFIVGGH